jgi:L-fucose mutarotase/ribose pyranase (RbsD/FucU family)
MGHGDEIVLADANFTATTLAAASRCCACPAWACSAPPKRC